MAKSTVKFNCGCGYTTDNYLEAALHVDSTGHTLGVLGEIQPDHRVDQRMANIGYGSSEALRRSK